jgi:hypothetical protein
MNDYDVVQILDLLDISGEVSLKKILSDFSCPMNVEIESFLKDNSVSFAKQKMSITHLVFDSDGRFVAYFTLTHKPVIVRADMLSKSSCKRMDKHSRLDSAINAYTVSAFLVAQFGKNYAVDGGNAISGTVLMDLVCDHLKEVQHEVGGGVIFLECEEHEKLLNFYQSPENGFKVFGERFAEADGVKYIQLLRFL